MSSQNDCRLLTAGNVGGGIRIYLQSLAFAHRPFSDHMPRISLILICFLSLEASLSRLASTSRIADATEAKTGYYGTSFFLLQWLNEDFGMTCTRGVVSQMSRIS